MNRCAHPFALIFKFDVNRGVVILIIAALLSSLFNIINNEAIYYVNKFLFLITDIFIAIFLIKKIGNKISEKSILILLFSPSFYFIYNIYNSNNKILWSLFFLSIILSFIRINIINYLLCLIIFSICLFFDFRFIFLSPLIFYCIFSNYSAGRYINRLVIFGLFVVYVAAGVYYHRVLVVPPLSLVDYFYIGLNFLIACLPLVLYGLAWRFRVIGFLCAMGLGPWVLMGLPIYFSIYCLVSVLTLASLLNLPAEKNFSDSGWSSLGIALLGAALWALPLKDSSHFRPGVFATLVNQFSTAPTLDPLRHPFWHRVGKQYSSVIIGNFYAVQGRVAKENFIFYLKRVSNIEHVEYKNDQNWSFLSAAQPNGKSIYILDDWASNPELVIFFDPSRDLLTTIDGYSVFVPGWVACKDGCPEIAKGLPLDWRIYKSWPDVEGGLLIERIPPEFNSVGKVFFNDVGEGLSMLLAGWSTPEVWGVWTESSKAGLLIPYKDHTKKSLVLTSRALINAQYPNQRVDILLNGVFQNSVELIKAENNLLTVSLDKIPASSNYFTVELKINAPRSPREIGMGDDARKLGVGLVSAQFE